MKDDNSLITASLEKYAVIAMAPDTLQQIVQQNIGAGGLHLSDLDAIVVPAGGGTAFTIPTPEGERTEKEIEGVIVLSQMKRAFWSTPMEQSEGTSPPDCASDDGLIGVGNPGGECANCAMAQFGSKEDGRGQACRPQQHVFMVRKSDVLPIVVKVPPTSLKPMRKYLLRLASKAIPYTDVLTRIGLARSPNRSGIVYSQLVPTSAGELSPEHAARMRTYAENLKHVL